jgi:V8-like Glu-specific endopeptidase
MIILFLFTQIIYGAIFMKDDRILSNEVTNSDWKKLSQSVGVIIGDKEFSDDFGSFGYYQKNSDLYEIIAPTLSQSLKNKNCSDLRFKDLMRAGHCSVVMVNKRQALTAGHCLMSLFNHENNSDVKFRLKAETKDWPYLNKIKIVLNQFKVENLENQRIMIKAESVYSIVKIMKLEDSYLKDDFALLEIDRDYNGFLPEINGEYKINDEVLMIGHPLGQPMMMTQGQITNDYIFQFTTNLDSFEGASGAPVFNLKDHSLIGLISVGTGPSFTKNENKKCVEYKVYNQDENYSTSVTKVSRVFNQPSKVELFLSTLSHAFDLEIPYDIYKLEDFNNDLVDFKKHQYSFYYEALMNLINFNSMTSLVFLSDSHFSPDVLACEIFTSNRLNFNRAQRNYLDKVFQICQ